VESSAVITANVTGLRLLAETPARIRGEFPAKARRADHFALPGDQSFQVNPRQPRCEEINRPTSLTLVDSCQNCPLKADGFFCQFSPAAVTEFDALKFTSIYPKRSLLFLEGQDPRGIFLLCAGEVKLSISSSQGKSLVLRVAKAGDVLGLMAVLSGGPYEATAETLGPCQVAFVRREAFLWFVAMHPESSQNLVRKMTSQYGEVCEQLRTVGLSPTPQIKLARLLLAWPVASGQTNEGGKFKLPLTHEQMAEFIGASRETVTRTLREFRTRNLVSKRGSELTMLNRIGLERFVNS